MIKGAVHKLNVGISRIVCDLRPNRIVEKTLNQLRVFLHGADNRNWDFETNGEKRVLECLRLIEPSCIFDVGANEGDWALMARQIFPGCTVHSFEIVPSTFETLLKKTKNDPGIVTVNFGLSDKPGQIVINCSSHSTTTATANRIEGLGYHDDYYDRQIECEVSTGKQYLDQRGLSVIDFLKIDVEGMDYKVLKGFGAGLQKVRVIQFEYGIFNIASRDLLLDFFLLLESHGFLIGKIYPKFVDFFDYHFSREDFGGHNYVAVKHNERELIARLKNQVT